MLSIRRSHERGHSQHNWLNSFHSFSFAEYYDPRFMGISHLRVLNDDTLEPKAGFPSHSHQNMEIISYVLEGALEHKDNMGNISIIQAGEVQCMSAGTSITHSEYNPSETELTRFLQIWIVPREKQLTPSYSQQSYTKEERQGRLCLIASSNPEQSAVVVHQNIKLFNSLLAENESVEYSIHIGRVLYIHVAKGQVRINGQQLAEGDSATVHEGEKQVTITGIASAADILLFDLQDMEH